jgi:hypothetical protein
MSCKTQQYETNRSKARVTRRTIRRSRRRSCGGIERLAVRATEAMIHDDSEWATTLSSAVRDLQNGGM